MSTLPDYEAALAAALAVAAPRGDVETVDLDAAAGRVLAEDVVADRDLPPFDRAQMDGYALRAAEVGVRDAWPVARTIAAGQAPGDVVAQGACVAIATGAPLPPGVDTVIQHEKSDRADPVRFTIDTVDAGHAVHPRAADARAGDRLIAAGTVLAARHLGIAASVGRATLTVVAAPRVVVIGSGDEIVPVTADPLPHQVRNSNAPLVATLARAMGAGAVACAHVVDDADATERAVARALADADVCVSIGGVSAGERDFFPGAYEQHGVRYALHGAAIQPGKPVRIGTTADGTIVVALPGNPVSALACACLFLWPILRRLQGADPTLPWHEVALDAAVRPNPRRRAFRPARTVAPGRVVVPRWAGSGDLAHTATTDGLVALPVQPDEVPAGTRLPFLAWPA